MNMNIPSKETNTDPTDGLPNYSIIHSPSFTFLVGPRHTKLTIQSGLAQHVSKPLHNLMNNGHTRESRHRIAVLEEEDVETFVAFCEYAYTGDYKVPQIPVPREHRVGVAESAHSPVNSWRGTYRSSSMSSAVPPPAPSPPPEFVDNGPAKIDSENQQPEPEPESTPVIGEEPAAEAAAEAEVQAEEVPKETEAQVEAEPTEEDNSPVKPAQEPTEKKNDEAEQTQDAGLSSPPEVEQQPETEPATETDDWATWPADQTPKENTEAKGKKGKKKDKKKQKKNLQALEGEAPANLTPPTTPPTHPVEMHEISPDNAEEPAEPIEADPVAEQTAEAASSEIPAETPAEPEHFDPEPAEATPAETEPTQPSPADAEQDPESVPKPTATPPPEEWSTPNNEEQQDNEVWPSNDQPEPIDPPKPVIDMSFAKQPDTSPRTPGMSLWDEFATLQYNDENHNQHRHHNQVMPISTTDETITEIPYLTFHAKVYVFATRYLIPALAQLCLRKLHHDLVHLTFADASASAEQNQNQNQELDPYQDRSGLGGLAARQAPRVLDLIRYSYTKTTRLEPISPTSATQLRENELRRLVVHYTACKVKELARYHSPGDSEVATPSLRPIDVHAHAREKDDAPKSLRSLLDMTPELASDLVYRMM